MTTKNNQHKVTLVIFSCENREHLLHKTIDSFKNVCDYQFNKIIIGLDGNINLKSLSNIEADLIVQNPQRLGYISNILNVLNLIETEFFFWLEDDWNFSNKVQLEIFLDSLQKHSEWVQIRLSKIAPLSNEDKKTKLDENIYLSTSGFSANPCLCRTEDIKNGFQALVKAPKGSQLGTDGFENFLTKWFSQQSKICAVLNPGQSPSIIHSGSLERTGRQWHMTASVDTKLDFIAPLGDSQPISRKIFMIFKLFIKIIRIGIRLFWSSSAYDLAFRIVTVKEQKT